MDPDQGGVASFLGASIYATLPISMAKKRKNTFVSVTNGGCNIHQHNNSKNKNFIF